ncbi:MAG: hypothetical protein Q7W55_13595 [Pseudohongiella sp.]|nr:hypothetical protein [Pseudohongiella sp.]
MRRFEELKKLDKKTRNKLRAILSSDEGNAIIGLANLRNKLGRDQAVALDAILNSPVRVKAVWTSPPFPKKPPFVDTLQAIREVNLDEVLDSIEKKASVHKVKLEALVNALHQIDKAYANLNLEACPQLIVDTIEDYGWSHALLRRIVLIRENLPEGEEDETIEALVTQANIKEIIISSLIHTYSIDQSMVTIKRSILNIADRGIVNRYSRSISRISVQPFANSKDDLAAFLSEVEKCSLIDAIIIAKFNSHAFSFDKYPVINEIANNLGKVELFGKLVATYDHTDQDSEYMFFKQSSAWLEYEPVRQYRVLVDNFSDALSDENESLPESLSEILQTWVGDAKLEDLVRQSQFTNHSYQALANLELSGTVTRSAIFNYWLHSSEGQIGFEKDDLLTLMGKTRDLARSVPLKATRTAAKLANDELVRLILLLLLARRSKNELDSFNLRKLLETIALKNHNGSLVKLVKSYEKPHPYVAEYIYETATEDFLAKLNKLAPHRSDIPEIRASLHEWMADFKKDDHFLQRARAVRIDHQINRVRNEIDDHRIYVDPSRFSSWIEDEMMIELSDALTSTGSGKKGTSVNCNETLLSYIVKQCYTAFCSNAVFGIASYIGRRIRHGTFHGHLYSSVINPIEKNEKYSALMNTSQFNSKWANWKSAYSSAVEDIIRDRLHVLSKAKPLGLLQPEVYGAGKLEILTAAVKSISADYSETTSVTGIEQIITDYCWRLAEIDLAGVTKYLKAQQTPIKNLQYLRHELLPSAPASDSRLAESFCRELELSIDRKLTGMFGWFKRPSIVAPKAFVSVLFDATVAEIRDTIPEFDPQAEDYSDGEIELVGGVYHLVYDSLAVVVANAAKHGDRSRPVRRRFEIIPGKMKQLVVEITSYIKPTENLQAVSAVIERQKEADFQDANLYQGKSGISKLMLLAHKRQDFLLNEYRVVDDEVRVRLAYALEH